ncbi:MAG: DUF3996 domain-containing protein [Bacteroidota bacterium]
MKRFGLMVICALVFTFADAQPKKFGIGVVVGAPTGLSIKYWSSSREAIQGYAGGGFGGVTLGVDYLFHSNAFNNSNLPFYYGPGAFIGSASIGGPRYDKNSLGLGLRFMFGADYLFPNNPFDISFEVGPALVFSPVVGLGLEAGLAFRFYP